MWEELKQQFRNGQMFTRLILANVGIYLVTTISVVFFHQFNPTASNDFLLKYTAVTSNLWELLFKPWTIISYQFIHQQFSHILYNMLMLYFGGRLFTEYLSDKNLLRVYLGSGIAGALIYITAYNLLPVYVVEKNYSVAIGSSASALGIFIAIATYIPNFMVSIFMLFEVRLKYVAVFLVLLDLINLDKGNAGGHFTHLGGALFGYLYAINLRKGRDWFGGMAELYEKLKKRFSPRKPSLKKVYQAASKDPSASAFQRERMKQEVVDRILDKISRSGYNSLTKEEKEILFHASKDK
ncbi:MAG: rhomboid family intramembrane serine protease [Bacteroidota bacterium]|jgi:membrane associated rhomboid family serine protease